MNDKIRRLFLLTETDTEYFNDKVDKIEYVRGSLDLRCTEHLFKVNNSYHESEKFQRNKDFHNSIETLKKAYYKTLEIKEPSNIKFAEFLRSTILNSLENIHRELEKMSSGIFRTKRYESSRLEVGKFLREYQKKEQKTILLQNNNHENHLERHLKVQVG